MDSTNKNVEYSTPEELCEAIRADIDTYDGILIGFGTELFRQKNTGVNRHGNPEICYTQFQQLW